MSVLFPQFPYVGQCLVPTVPICRTMFEQNVVMDVSAPVFRPFFSGQAPMLKATNGVDFKTIK